MLLHSKTIAINLTKVKITNWHMFITVSTDINKMQMNENTRCAHILKQQLRDAKVLLQEL